MNIADINWEKWLNKMKISAFSVDLLLHVGEMIIHVF